MTSLASDRTRCGWLLVTLLWATSGCGEDPPCEKSGPPCSEAEPPEIDERHVAAAVTWTNGEAVTFQAYGEGNVYWTNDGHSLSLRAAAPAFQQGATPRLVTLMFELHRDVDDDPPGCYASERIWPLCFRIGAGLGGNATLEDGTDYYVTEGDATGTLELLGTGASGELLGTFDVTLFRKEGETLIEGQQVQFDGARFSMPRK
jgi:hypothetical protein